MGEGVDSRPCTLHYMILTSLPVDIRLSCRVLGLFASFHAFQIFVWCWKGDGRWCLIESEACACDKTAYAIVSVYLFAFDRH